MRQTKIYIGTSGWNYDHWDEVFYPSDLPKSKRFEYYAKQFNAVEVNATFYRTFKESTYKKWHDKAPQGFRYILKVPRFVSHRKHLDEIDKNSIDRFVENINILKSKLGGLLLQIGPNTNADADELKSLLMLFGSSINIAVEFRKDDWFNDKIKNVLEDTGATFCDTDSPKYSFKEWITSDVVYLRLHGKDKWYEYDYPNSELGKLAKRVEKYQKRKVKEIFVFFNNDFNGYAPLNALKLKEFLNL